MLTKEEIIILRTIFLEFGDEELRQQRYELPYENMEYNENDNVPKANLGALIADLKPFEKAEIDYIVRDFYLAEPEESSNKFSIIEGKQRGVDFEDEENVEYRDTVYFLRGCSTSEFFLNLRMGLYYKSIHNYEKAIEHLEEAHRRYLTILRDTIQRALGKHVRFLSQFYDFDNKMVIEPYSKQKHGPSPEEELPLEMFISIEEMPSFHLGEIYFDVADNNFKKYEDSKILSSLNVSEEHYAKTLTLFDESRKWHAILNYGQSFNDPPYDLSRLVSWLRDFEVIDFPHSPYKRNPYLEVIDTTSRNQLNRIEQEKFLSTVKSYEYPDRSVINGMRNEAVSSERSKRINLEKKHEVIMEKYKKYYDTFPNPDELSLPRKVLLKLEKICHESEECLRWYSNHFRHEGLKYLEDFKVKGKPKKIMIISGPDNIDDSFEKSFQKFINKMEPQNTSVEMRILVKSEILRKIHDRWIITDTKAYNVPPVASISQKQYAEICQTDREAILPRFNEWWNEGIDILTGDWREIQRARDMRKQYGRNRGSKK